MARRCKVRHSDMIFEVLANDAIADDLDSDNSVSDTGLRDAATMVGEDQPLVILLHGYPQTFHTWREQVPALESAGYLAIAPNQRGYSPGARPNALEAYRAECLVADVLALAAKFGRTQFHLVGHDWGGQIAWLVACRAPHQVRSLSVLSRPHPSAFAKALSEDPEQAERSRHHRIFHQPETAGMLLEDDARRLRRSLSEQGVDASDIERYLEPFTDEAALDAALNWYRAGAPAAIPGSGPASSSAVSSVLAIPELGPCRVPTLFIWGDSDSSVGQFAASETALHVDAPYRFEVLPGVGHFVTDQASQLVTEALLEHLSTYR